MTDELFDDDETVEAPVHDDGPIVAPYVLGPRLAAWRMFWDVVPPAAADVFGLATAHYLDVESGRQPPPSTATGNYEALAQWMASIDEGDWREHLRQIDAEREADRRLWSKLPKESLAAHRGSQPSRERAPLITRHSPQGE